MEIIQNFTEFFTFRWTQWWTWFVESVWPNNITEVKVPQNMNWGGLIAFMHILDLFKLIFEWLKFATQVLLNPSGWAIPTCYKVRSFVCKHFYPNWLWVILKFCDMGNILMDMYICNITPPPSRVLSSCTHYKDKILETILKFIWSCQFLSLELQLSEIDGSQGKPTTQVSYPLCYWCLCLQISILW